MKLRYFIAASVLTLALLACETLPQQVIVAPQDLKSDTILVQQPGGSAPEAVPIDVTKAPEKYKQILQQSFPNQNVVYLTTIDHVKTQAPVLGGTAQAPPPVIIPITPPTDPNTGQPDFGTWLSQAAPVIGGLLPTGAGPFIPLAGYLIGLFASKRSRGHLADTASALNPLDGASVDIGGALSSFGKAIGYSHSTQTPAELRALADKLEMEQKLDTKLAAASTTTV
jgi:hypothetical protein